MRRDAAQPAARVASRMRGRAALVFGTTITAVALTAAGAGTAATSAHATAAARVASGAGVIVASASAAADPCRADAAGRASAPDASRASGGRVESTRYVVVFRPEPAPIAVGQHFSLDAIVCPRGGAPPARGLRVDAVMPEHRHGMNYRATVSPRGEGRFTAEGLLFHMPGRWQLVFDVDTGAARDRVIADVVLP